MQSVQRLCLQTKCQQGRFFLYKPKMLLLVSNDAQVDGGISMFLDGGQQSGAVGVSDFPRVEVVLWIQQLHKHRGIQLDSVANPKRREVCVYFHLFTCMYLVSSGHDGHHRELVHANFSHPHCSQQADL